MVAAAAAAAAATDSAASRACTEPDRISPASIRKIDHLECQLARDCPKPPCRLAEGVDNLKG